MILNLENKQELTYDAIRNQKVVIWGMGGFGRRLQIELYSNECTDFLFCDNDRNALEKYKETIRPEELISEKYVLFLIIIAIENSQSVESVYTQMVSMGISSERIFRYEIDVHEKIVEYNRSRGYFNGIKTVFPLQNHDSIKLLRQKISTQDPFLISRWGSLEGEAVMCDCLNLEVGREKLLYELCNNAGVFPRTVETLKDFSNVMQNAANSIDILITWLWMLQEKWLYKRYSPNAILCSSIVEYPFFEETSWTRSLAGKRVLVIHPFARLIKKQYEKRDKFFAAADILPEFDLQVYEAVQSMGGSTQYASWIEALERMQNDISVLDFDIALIGCGAYGMPLGAYIKEKMEKQAIHMGGTLQILFGIKGKRWEQKNYDYQHRLYNEYWIRPTDDLKPQNYQSVENGCYW